MALSCAHFALISSAPAFLTPHTHKLEWICLSDGCVRFKKGTAMEDLHKACAKLTAEHKIMINCQSLEIYCTHCQVEIYDWSAAEQAKKKIHPIMCRRYLVPAEEQQMFYGGHSQYPPSFQEQKKGLCGLTPNSLNSHLNSTIQLLAHVPVFEAICRQLNPSQLTNPFLRELVRTIQVIWSGAFRIYRSEQFSAVWTQQEPLDRSYHRKNPPLVLYPILRKILSETSFTEAPCANGVITDSPYDEWNASTASYNALRQIFAGACVLVKKCGSCQQTQKLQNRFECLRVSYDRPIQQGKQLQILALIEEAFSWRNNHSTTIDQAQKGQLYCKSCKSRIADISTFVDLPNNLIVEFGQDLQGLNVGLPDSIDLFKFSEAAMGGVKTVPQGKECVYDYTGCIFSKTSQYICHARNHLNNKEYTIIDASVQVGVRPKHNIKIAIYQRRPNPKNLPLYRNVASCLQVGVSPVVPLPDLWVSYLQHNHTVPPLMNPFISQHGKLKDNLGTSKCDPPAQRIPLQIYQYLLQNFGGRGIKMKHQNDYCLEYRQRKELIGQLKESQKEMASFADRLSHKRERVMISRKWLSEWKKFVYEQDKTGYKTLGYPRPGPIRNDQGQQREDYKRISPEVWHFLHKFYGGGPIIHQKQKQTPANAVVVAAVKLRLQNLQGLFEKLHLNMP